MTTGASGEEILVIQSGEIVSCVGSAAERFTVTDFLYVAESCGNALITVRVKGVEVQGNPAVAAAVYFAFIEYGFHGAVYDLGRGRAVGVNEPVPLVRFVISLHVTVSQGQLDGGFVGFLAAELGDAFLNRGIDCVIDCVHRFGITLGN